MSREHRREDRYNVVVAASYGEDAGARRPVRVTNLSARGCRFVVMDGKLAQGTRLTMAFGRVDAVSSRVKWRVGRTHGVRFDRQLAAAELDHIRLFLSEQPALVAERAAASA